MVLAFGEWTCHMCHESRPDAQISVLTYIIKEFEQFGPGTASANLRYCNDREQCIKAARAVAETGAFPTFEKKV